MSNIILTPEQDKGVKLAEKWWKSKDSNNRPFVINGYAGCGKSTLVSSLVNSLDMDLHNIRFATFTGQASSVLTAKGNPASTIHKLIYDPYIDKKDYKVKFRLKESLPKDIQLLVLDEYSQIDDKLMSDVLSFGIPTILLGDPQQHRPFKGAINKYMNDYDVMLTQPMRQALDNPIIYLATQIRNGENIKYGSMGDNVHIIRKEDIRDEYMINADQIIASKNKTVDDINNYVRKNIYNLDSPLPYIGEKISCVKNNWDMSIMDSGIEWYLFNGMSGYVTNLASYNDKLHCFNMSFKPTFVKENTQFKNITVDGIYFLENLKNDDRILPTGDLWNDYEETMINRNIKSNLSLGSFKINKFQYNYCQTTYKAQGSEYDSVLYLDEPMPKDFRQAARYVGVTRAKENLVFVM